MSSPPPAPDDNRRDFFKKSSAIVAGSILALAPPLAGLPVVLDPLRRKSGAGKLVKVATLAALPNDGLPRKFAVVADRTDAWNKFPNTPIGAVYLRRTQEGKVEALNVVCPHAGCFIDFVPSRSGFYCPCHNSAFGLDGGITDPKSPSARAMDALDVEVRNESEVWVRFQNFEAGKKEKIAVA